MQEMLGKKMSKHSGSSDCIGVAHAAARFTLLGAILAVVMVLYSHSTYAAEGGSSNHLPGAYGNFAVAVAPAPGVYFQNDLFYYDGDVSATVLSG